MEFFSYATMQVNGLPGSSTSRGSGPQETQESLYNRKAQAKANLQSHLDCYNIVIHLVKMECSKA